MTVFDLNKRIAVTLHQIDETLVYHDASVTCNPFASEMEATLRSTIDTDHPWRKNHYILFDALSNYYHSLLHALNRFHLQSVSVYDSPHHRHRMTLTGILRLGAQKAEGEDTSPTVTTATLQRKWSLLPKYFEPDNEVRDTRTILRFPSLSEDDALYLVRGYEHILWVNLASKWRDWVVEYMNVLRDDARNDCHHALVDPTSEKAEWELTELDVQLAWEWTRRELMFIHLSAKLEDILHRRMEECVAKLEEGGKKHLRDWLWSEFWIGQRKRVEREREQAKARMIEEQKAAAGRAEREGRPWKDGVAFDNVGVTWQAGQEFIDRQWKKATQRGVSYSEEEATFKLNKLVKKHEAVAWDSQQMARLAFMEQLKPRFEHWNTKRAKERRAMEDTIERISKADFNDLDEAYYYPEAQAALAMHSRFTSLAGLSEKDRAFAAKYSSATVYDVWDCGIEVVRDFINSSSPRSLIKVRPNLIASIPDNVHLLYVNGRVPSFIRRNRDRWWDEQTSNSSTFYLSPQYIGRQYVYSRNSTIAHIMVFVKTATYLRLRLLHRRGGQAFITIRDIKQAKVLHLIPTDKIPEEPRLQDFELGRFEQGKYELELVVSKGEGGGDYGLRDILVDFLDSDPHS